MGGIKVKITVTEAAKKLGIYPQGLRIALQQGKFSEFGEAWKAGERWTYYINKNRLENYLSGKEVQT